MAPSPQQEKDYQSRLTQEERFYREREDVHNLPDVFHYWSQRYIRPKLEAVGFKDPKHFFHDSLARQCERHAGVPVRFLSVGSGNCDVEIELAVKLREASHSNFTIDCLDLNQTMLDRGKSAADRQGLAAHINPVQGDFNAWRPSSEYDGVIAIQALHHVVNLEGLFAGIKDSLKPGGCFAISDMIGRNGHQRWPEALAIIHEFWRRLPPSYRYNHQVKRYEEMFEDWDCSTQGFEGIRFSLKSEWDLAFIDQVQQRNEEEMALGRIKPTQMFAIVTAGPDGPPLFEAPFSPAFCVRQPDGPPVPGSIPDAPVDPYGPEAWSQDDRRQLEIACRRLREVSQQIGHLQSSVAKTTAWALELDKEFQSRTEWAFQLDKELQERTAWAVELNKELEERTAWARDLDRRLHQGLAQRVWRRISASFRR
jgi:SAM-dependent methyltransferase